MTYANSTALTVREVTRAGLDISAALQTPDGTNGNKFSNNGRTVMRLKNTNAATRTATFQTPGSVDGQAIADLDVVVPATTGDVLVGPFTGNFHQPGTQDIFVSYSAVTDLTVDVIRLASE